MSELLFDETAVKKLLPALKTEITPTLRINQEISDAELAVRFVMQRDKSGRQLSPRTIESYKRDLKRLYIFLSKREKTFRQAESKDVQDFTEWLKEPGAEDISDKRYKRTDERWRPFFVKSDAGQKGLSRVSIRQQHATISSFYSWMVRNNYLVHNVFGEERNAKPTKIKVERHLLDDEIKAVNDYLSEATPKKGRMERVLARQKWLWFAYFLTGLRISELLSITGKDISHDRAWSVNVLGKGRIEAEPLTVPTRFIKELLAYRKSLGLYGMPSSDEHLLLSIKGTEPLKNRASAHRIFKSLVNDVANDMKMKDLGIGKEDLGRYPDPVSVRNIRRSSTHWLRHGFVTQLFKTTNDIATISKMARHMDLKTTAQYSHAEAEKQQKILDNFAKGFR